MTLLGYFFFFSQPHVRFTFFLRSIRFGLAFSWFWLSLPDLNLAEFLFSVCISMDGSCFLIFLHFLRLHVRCDRNMDYLPLGG